MRGLFRSTVVACLLAGVVLVSSGFAVVSGAKVAKPGGVCGKAGARVVSQSVSLVCKKKVSGKLVWRVVKASTTSTTTTTTVTSIKNSAPKVAVVAPRVVSASAATGNAVITIADMSPDTGVYAVQWVPVGQSFNSFSMYRTTTKTMTVPYLSCTRTYTLRVFVMQENWQMTDGFVNQNVTPHSATFDLTMPACRDAATTVAALTCAQGGLCAIGDTGPGGGIVFYVQALGGTFTCGATLTSTCKYLEAAPTSGTAAWTVDRYIWWGDVFTEIGVAAQGTLIGTGLKNTLAMVTQSNTEGRAGTITRAYRGPNNLTDWYLPSKDELNELCKYAKNTGQAVGGAIRCTGGSDATLRGFPTRFNYWSSSELDADDAWQQSFNSGDQLTIFKGASPYVHPVRAF